MSPRVQTKLPPINEIVTLSFEDVMTFLHFNPSLTLISLSLSSSPSISLNISSSSHHFSLGQSLQLIDLTSFSFGSLSFLYPFSSSYLLISIHKYTAVMITKAIEGDTKTNNNKTINEDFEADMLNGFPWPPRCYICSFCKREFKSAQALGGHMNIHRKDRARLRSSVPNSHLFNAHYTQNTIPNLNLNPNPSLISSSSSLPFSTRQQLLSPLSTTSFSSMPSWLSPSYHPPPTFLSPSSSYYHTQNLSKRLVGGNPRSLNQSREVKINSKAEEVGSMMRLDLEIGVLGGNSKDDIDLELRLGY